MISKPNLCNMKQGWEIKKLGEICNIKTGKLDANAKVDDGKYPFFTCDSKPYRIDTYAFDDEAILISGNGSLVGHINYYKGKFNAYQRTYVLTKFQLLNLQFIIKYLKHYLRPYIMENRKGGCIPYITLPILQNFSIPYPPLAEQERIVAELDCLSGVIEKKKQQLKDLDALAQSIFYEMFGDPITNEKGWKVNKLGDLCKTTSGGTPSKGHDEYYNGGTIPWLRSGEVNKLYIYDTELFITEEGLRKSSAKWLPEDTVVIAMYGATVGQVGILKNKMTTNQAICGILPNEYFTPVFLYHFLLSKKKDYLKLAAGGAQPNISQNIIKDTLILLPPLTLQQAFASKIEAIEKQKELIKQSIKEVETLFNSRMDYYFN